MLSNAAVEQLALDIRRGCRALLRGRGVTAIAVVSLALGIGANTAIFTIVHAYLLQEWQVREPGELVFVRARGASGRNGSFVRPTIDRLREAAATSRTFATLAAFDESTVTVTIDGQPEVVYADFASGDYFPMLGIQPRIGRLLTPDDDRPGQTPPVAVLSHAYWLQRFGGDPRVLGTTITLKDVVCTIVGVTDPDYHGRQTAGTGAELILPLWLHGSLALKDHLQFELIGRLASGVTPDAARAALDAAYQQARQERADAMSSPATAGAAVARAGGLPRTGTGPAAAAPLPPPRAPLPDSRIELQSARRGDFEDDRFARQMWILQIVAGLVLLIASVNVASLALARGAGRQHEIAVKFALGATRRRLIRQLLVESAIVSCVGGLLGVMVARCGSDAMLALTRGGASAAGPALHAPTPMFTAGLIVLATLVCGIVPALRLTRGDVTSDTQAMSLRTRGLDRTSRAGWSLIVLQVALSIVILIPAGLLTRSVAALGRVDFGFDADRLLVMWVFPALAGYEGPREQELYQRLLDRLDTLPGVETASMSRYSVLRRGRARGLTIHGTREIADPGASFVIDAVAPGFFEALGLRLLAGRDISRVDTPQSVPVVVVNDTLARRYFEGGRAVGERIEIEGASREIVGVVSSMRFGIRDTEPVPAVYVAYTQAPDDMLGQMLLKVRTRQTASDAATMTTLVPAIRGAIREVAPTLAPVAIQPQTQDIRNATNTESQLAMLIGGSGLLALFLALVGLYGTMTHAVMRRTNEVGVRLALGARPADVARMILADVGRLALAGVVIGIPCAFIAARVVASFLFGVGATDVSTTLVCTGGVVVVAIAAGALPARRAARVDPLVALRRD